MRRKTQEEFEREVRELTGDEFTVLGEYISSKVRVRMLHNTCGREFEMMPASFLYKGCRCTHCAKGGGLKRDNAWFMEKLADEGDVVTGEYEFLEEYAGYHEKIAVKHHVCGHEYRVTPNKFLMGRRCPKCAKGGVKRNHEWFMERVQEQEYYDGDYTFLEEYQTYHTKILVRHEECGHEYRVTPHMFLGGRRCPHCDASHGEKRVASVLTSNGIEYEREKTFEGLVDKRPLRYDFYITDVGYRPFLIEYDGEQHYKPTIYDEIEPLSERQRRDRIKNRYARDNNIPLYRIPYTQINNIKEIVEALLTQHHTIDTRLYEHEEPSLVPEEEPVTSEEPELVLQ